MSFGSPRRFKHGCDAPRPYPRVDDPSNPGHDSRGVSRHSSARSACRARRHASLSRRGLQLGATRHVFGGAHARRARPCRWPRTGLSGAARRSDTVDSTGLGRVSQTCIEASGPCAASFRSGQIANVLLWVLAALVLAQAVLLLPFGTPLAALITGAYLLLNFAAAKWLQWLVSDALALFLVSLTTCLAAWAMRHRSWSAWIPVGLGLGALAMTKAVFVPFAALAVLAATFLGAVWRSRRVLLAAAAFGLGFLLVAGPWVARNTVVTGRPQLTDARSGIARCERCSFT